LKRLEEEYPDGMHDGNCFKHVCQCSRCAINEKRLEAEEYMEHRGWISSDLVESSYKLARSKP
jgi:hypothetical protein